MSDLAGFIAVFQIRRDKLLDLIQENLLIQGNPLTTPFRLFQAGPLTGLPPQRLNIVDLLVKSLSLILDPGTNLCTLILNLEGGVIRLPNETACPFQGGQLKVRIQLVDGTFLFARPLSMTLDAPGTSAMAAISGFTARANAEVDRLLDAERNRDFDLFPEASLAKNIFVLFNHHLNLDPDTLAVTQGSGNAAQLTPSVSAGDPVSLAIASEVITRDLPEADTFSRSPITVTRVGVVFRDGFIDLDGDFDGEDDCWSIDNGHFSQKLFAKLSGGQIVFTPEPDVPVISYSIDVEWYCLLAIGFLSALQTAVVPIANELGVTWSQIFLRMASNTSVPGTVVTPQQALPIPGVAWTRLAVTPEGIVLYGQRGGTVSPVQRPGLHIRTNEAPQNLRAVGEGSVVVQAPTCTAKSFDYTEYVQDDWYTLQVETELLFEPVECEWEVNGQPLVSENLILIIGGGNMSSLDYTGTIIDPIPPPNGTAIAGHQIQLLYRVGSNSRGSNSSLLLSARQQDENYDIRVEVRGTDALGRAFTDAVNLTMVGKIVRFGTDYDEYLDDCLKETAKFVDSKGRKSRTLKPGETQERWQDLLDFVSVQAQAGNPEARAVIPAFAEALGARVVGKALADQSFRS